MFKKIFVSLTVITLSTLTSFPAFASISTKNMASAIHEFKYMEFRDNIDNTEKLTKDNNSDKSSKANNIEVAENVVSNDDEESKNTNDIDSNTDSNEGYISSLIMESTAYTGGTVTASGTAPIRNENGISTVAVDPSVIPLGSLLYIDGYGYAAAEDTGGAIHGNIVDLYLNSYDECIDWGRQNVSVKIIAYPGQW